MNWKTYYNVTDNCKIESEITLNLVNQVDEKMNNLVIEGIQINKSK